MSLSIANISVWTVVLAVVGTVVSVALTLGIYYLATGDYFWDRDEGKADRRNWPPSH